MEIDGKGDLKGWKEFCFAGSEGSHLSNCLQEKLQHLRRQLLLEPCSFAKNLATLSLLKILNGSYRSPE